MKYNCGDIRSWTGTDDDCRLANKAVADFDGWLQDDIEDWQVEDIRNAILLAIRKAKSPSDPGQAEKEGADGL